MRKRTLLWTVTTLCLATGLVGATGNEPVPVLIYDHTGSLVTDTWVGVTDGQGNTVAKLPPASDGVYRLDSALRGRKVVFRVLDPALGNLNTMDARIPDWVEDSVIVTLPEPPSPTGVPVNDTCENAIPIGSLPALVAGSTVGATVDSDVEECDTPNTAGGVWYFMPGTGGPVTFSTCELNSPGSANYDTKISVYCLGCEYANCVVGNDDTPGGDFCGFTFHSTVTVATEALAEYSILVHGFSTQTGDFNLSVAEGGVPTHPGQLCVPFICTGACCIQDCNDPVFGHCAKLTEDQCAEAGGEYHGNHVPCFTPNGTTLSLNNPTPVVIPDGTSEFACSSIDVGDPATCDVISDLDVGVIITHTWIGDLVIEVTGPDGATTNMWDNRCGSTENMDFFFDDEGTDSLCSIVAAPGVGRGDPTLAGLGPALWQFNGLDPSGRWELCVADTFPADSGTLNNWVLEIDCGTAICVFEPPEPEPMPVGKKGDDDGRGNGADVLGIERFGDHAEDDGSIDPVIRTRPRGDNVDRDSDRGPSRSPAGDRLPR